MALETSCRQKWKPMVGLYEKDIVNAVYYIQKKIPVCCYSCALRDTVCLQTQTGVSAEISATRYVFTRITSELFCVTSILLPLSTWDASLENWCFSASAVSLLNLLPSWILLLAQLIWNFFVCFWSFLQSGPKVYVWLNNLNMSVGYSAI